jgi:hypothetical protein
MPQGKKDSERFSVPCIVRSGPIAAMELMTEPLHDRPGPLQLDHQAKNNEEAIERTEEQWLMKQCRTSSTWISDIDG